MTTRGIICKILLTAFFLTLCQAVSAQRNTGRGGKSDKDTEVQAVPTQEQLLKEYGEAQSKRHELAAKIDSLNQAVAKARESLVANSLNKDYYSAQIVDMEKSLFSARDELKRIDERLQEIERGDSEIAALYLKTAEETSGQPKNPPRQYKYLILNDFIKSELSAADYRQLCSAQEAERQTTAGLRRVRENYDQMADIYALYLNADTQAGADPLYDEIMEYNSSNESALGTIERNWTEIFDTKIYSYNFILDKINASDQLGRMQDAMSEMKQAELELSGKYMYDFAAAYPLRKKLLLDYEMIIAEIGGLTQAADSLARAKKNIDGNYYQMPKLDLTERLFIDYENIEVLKTSPYGSSNPIPKCTVYPKGTIYRVLLGVYPRQQAVSVFKNLVPLSWEQKPDNKYYYYAGGFATYEDAEKGLEAVKKAGFSKAAIVVWQGGEYISDNVSAVNGRSAHSGQQAGAEYRIEITVAEGGLPQGVKDVIASRANDRELTRSPGKRDGEAIFVLGLFDSKVLAESIANEISSADPSVGIKVSEAD